MSVHFPTIASGQTVSSGFFLDRGDRAIALYAMSAAAGQVGVQFAVSTASEYSPLFPQVQGTTFCFSGAEGWVTVTPPTPFYRVFQSAATVAPRSFCVLELNRV